VSPEQATARNRARLRERLAQFEVALLDYGITSNHVPLLLDAEERRQISGVMRTVAGEFTRSCNRRKELVLATGDKRRIFLLLDEAESSVFR
jgi:hypothetical protein